ncbi:SDR family oxidoreductase [Streptomyces griseoincarnatus]
MPIPPWHRHPCPSPLPSPQKQPPPRCGDEKGPLPPWPLDACSSREPHAASAWRWPNAWPVRDIDPSASHGPRPTPSPGGFHEVDLSDRAATDTALRAALAHGPVDAVVNNVGLVRPASVHEADLDDLYAVYDVTVRVAAQVVQAALPAMTAHGWVRIVNITSLVTVGRPERTAYGAAALPHPEIASAVLYLASEAASAVRGVLLPVDGGRTAV